MSGKNHQKVIGTPTSRVDGRAKTTGSAKYAADYNGADLAHGWVVSSAIAKGRVIAIHAQDALARDGVLAVLTHVNKPRVARQPEKYRDDSAPEGEPFRPLSSDRIFFAGQPVALVVAEDLETARFAATLIRVEYERSRHVTDLAANRDAAHTQDEDEESAPPDPRGDADRAFGRAPVRFEAEYSMAVEHHNPLELQATTAIYEKRGKITVYEKTQGVQNSARYIANVFGLAEKNISVCSPYVGGAFGLGLRPQYQLILAVMAARHLERSVRVSLTRQQMFTLGYRPETIQRIALGAEKDGRLTAFIHHAVSMTSRVETYQETVVGWSGALYNCANTRFTHKLVQLDLCTPLDMRGPGGATGMFAIECAMDELATRVQVDPLELRLRNYSDRDQNEDKRFSSKELRACFRAGADRFGWARRSPKPRSMSEGTELIGWSLATGIWEAMQENASAKAILSVNGALTIACATTDIGTGTYTMISQIAADLLGLPLTAVTVKLGNSHLPDAPVQGGSFTAASVGSAVHAVCEGLRRRLHKLAVKGRDNLLRRVPYSKVIFANGRIVLEDDLTCGISIAEVLRHSGLDSIEHEATASLGGKAEKFARYTHSATFAEVRVDEQLGIIRVTRIVTAVAAGRILNPKTAKSQVSGGIVWGIGMALQENSMLDHDLGRFINHNLAEYHVPVNADINDIEVLFVEEIDDVINPLGVKGVGEIGVVGTAAAICNAVFHATGKRIRRLPITLDKLL